MTEYISFRNFYSFLVSFCFAVDLLLILYLTRSNTAQSI